MPSSQSAPIDWVALRSWYGSADEVLTIFDRCTAVTRELLHGGAEDDLREAARLGALTGEADEWLRLHPCPHESNGDWVTSIARLFAVIGAMVVASDGPGLGDDGALRTMIDDACGSVTEFRGLVARVRDAPDGDRSAPPVAGAVQP